MDNYFCIKHSNKKPKRICTQCNNVMLCNDCAINDHREHFDKIEPIGEIFNSKKEFFDKILEKRESINVLKFKCMKFMFHKGNNYCLDCKDFICEKCKDGHEHSNIIETSEFLNSIKEKFDLIDRILNFNNTMDSKPLIELNEISSEFKGKVTSFLQKMKNQYNNIVDVFQLVGNMFTNYNKFINESIDEAIKDIIRNCPNVEKLKSIMKDIKFEKEDSKIFEIYLEFYNIIEGNMLKENSFKLEKLMDSSKILTKQLGKYLVEINSIQSLFAGSLNMGDSSSISDLRESLMKTLQIQLGLSEERMSTFVNFIPKIYTNIEPSSCISNVTQTTTNTMPTINNTLIKRQPPQLELSSNFIYIPSSMPSNPGKTSPSVNVEILVNRAIIPLKITNSQFELIAALPSIRTQRISNFSDIDFKPKEVNSLNPNFEIDEEISQGFSFDSDKRESNTLPPSKAPHSTFYPSESRHSEAIETRTPEKINAEFNTCKLISTPEKEPVLEEELSFDQKLNKLQIKLKGMSAQKHSGKDLPIIEKKNMTDLLESLTWEERNQIEMISIGYNCKTLFVYNCLLDLITEHDYEDFKFPAFHSFLNFNNWVYISGGKDTTQNKDLSDFYRIKRTGDNAFLTEKLADLLEPRSYHNMTFCPNTGRIYAIGGSKISSVEEYDLNTNTWTMLPKMNQSREKPCSYVFNNKLYIFLGFDRTINKFVGTIDQIDLNLKDKFIEIKPKGSSNLIKKYGMSIIPEDGNKILIAGGINSFRSEAKEIMAFNFDNNTFTLNKEGLDTPTFFNHNSFMMFPHMNNKIRYNFSETFDIMKY